MRAARLLAVAAAAVSLTVGGVTHAGAEAPSATGWWWAGNISGLPVQPPPPEVPEGGLYVAGGPNGASGVSALRFQLSEDAAAPVLTLRVADSSGEVVIGACRAASPWTPTDGGPFEERPEAACEDGAVAGELVEGAAGPEVRLALQSLMVDGVLDVVLVPGADPRAEQVGATFSAAFEAPGADALSAGAGGAGGTAAPPTQSFTPPDTGSTSSGAGSFSPPPAGAPATFTPAPNVSPPPPPPVAVDEVAAGAVPEAVDVPGDVAPAAASSPLDDTRGRAVGAALGAAAIGVAYLLHRNQQQVRPAALGIGRFARTREGVAPRL